MCLPLIPTTLCRPMAAARLCCRTVVCMTLLFVSADPLHAAVLSDNAYGLTNLAGENQLDLTSNSAADTGKISIEDSNTGLGAGEAASNVQGLVVAASHACGEPTSTGQVSTEAGYAAAQDQDDFQITSTTLPAGTPVVLDFCVLTGMHEQINDSDAVNQTDIDVDATFYVTTGQFSGVYDRGDYSFVHNSSGRRTATTGVLFSGEQDFVVDDTVGQAIGVLAGLTSDTTADVYPTEVGDVQAQAALDWGITIVTPGVQLTSTVTGLAPPDMTNCSDAYVQAAIPPPLVNLPEPVSGSVGLVWAAQSLRRAQRRNV